VVFVCANSKKISMGGLGEVSLLNDKTSWNVVLKAKYGGKLNYPSNLLSRDKFKFHSLWWNDLCGLGEGLEIPQNWLIEFAKKSIGNGESTLFWHDLWVEENSLAYNFPILFSISTQKK